MTITSLSLSDLGYNNFFKSQTNVLEEGISVARVIAEYKELYRVKNEKGEYLAQITGKHRFNAIRREDYPAIGDWVTISMLPEYKAIIHTILERKTILKKKYSNKQANQIIATNVDVAFIVESMDRDYNLNRFERFLVLVIEGGITPVFVLNKIDLISGEELAKRIQKVRERFPSVHIVSTSTVSEGGVVELNDSIKKGETYCFLGSSGVGKSSLINRLLNKDEIKTREMGMVTGKGKHTTTTREMYFLENGGLLIDNPGTREVGIADSDSGIESVFNDIQSLSQACKFANCTHMHEPGCVVLAALEKEALDKERYENYIKLKKESAYYKMTSIEKREKDRKFGKFIKKALKSLGN